MKNREYEVKLQITEDDAQRIEEILVNRTKYKKEEQRDIYYCPTNENPQRYMKKKCIRVRVRGGKNTLDYKEILDGEKEYIQELCEYSTYVGNLKQINGILNVLGFKEIMQVHKKRIEGVYEKKYKIALDNVNYLGWFLEVELINVNIDEIDANMFAKNIIKDFGIKEVCINKEGYSNMLLAKYYGG